MPASASARAASCALVLVSLAAPGLAAAEDGPRLRAASPAARRMIDDATAASQTVRELIDAIDRSDVIVYIQLTGSPGVPTAATTWVTTTKEGRYLRVLINAGNPRWSLVPLLGHELQHVAEIAADPGVRGNDGIRALFTRIGTANPAEDRFETAAAHDIEVKVRGEVARHHTLARR